MVGAKQFAIMRKIIKDKKENPIVKSISMPKLTRGEKSFFAASGTFLDKFNAKPTIQKPKFNAKPIVLKPKKRVRNNYKDKTDIFDNFLSPNFMNFDSESKKSTGDKTSKANPKFSDELVNRLTYQVFQKIKNYLHNDSSQSSGNKQVKVEINL